jgi:Cof subfamily protein (haloacid dehalogenase superfamily)
MNNLPDVSKIKLIVSDIDGTLLKDDGVLGNETKKILLQLMEKGIKFSLATGRLHSAVQELASEIKINGSIISLDGSVIKDFINDKIIFESFISPSKVKKAIELAGKHLVNIALCHSDAIYFTENNSFIPEILSKYGAKYQEVNSYVDYINNTLEIIFVSDMQDAISKIRNRFEFPKSFGCRISYYRSSSKQNMYFLEVRKSGSSKGKALKRLLKYYKLGWDNIAVLGDWYNDTSMFETDALKIAVANAVPEIILKADFVTKKTNDEEGLCEFFEMILKSKRN